MRNVVIDYVRERQAEKRGGGIAVGYMGSAPVVAQADVYFPSRFPSRLTTVEPLPAQ